MARVVPSAAAISTALDHEEFSRIVDWAFTGAAAPDMGAYERFGIGLASNKGDLRLGLHARLPENCIAPAPRSTYFAAGASTPEFLVQAVV